MPGQSHYNGTMKKTTRLRELVTSTGLEFFCEAHNGLSAKIVEEAGFPAIWGSGLSISAQYGVRDSNEASWTQVLETVEFMADATTVPILLDGDTGYGNFNNVRRLIRKLEQRGIAGVCLEDKLFPKTNSFISGETQPLASMSEFSGKIKAACDARRDDDFVIVARVEAFIAGWGLEEALRRAECYREAGADAILIHSSLRVPDEVLAFQREWKGRLPVVIVPTKYYSTPTEVFEEAGFSVVLWANHILRSSIKAMTETARTLYSERNLLSIEDRIVPVAEVFRLQGAEELQRAEKRYLPEHGSETTAIVLAASRGRELGELTDSRPKAMVNLSGKPMLGHIVDAYNGVGIKDICVVRGYKAESVNLPGSRYVDNEDYDNSGELYSLSLALETIKDGRDLLISYGDVLFNKYIPRTLNEMNEPFALFVDTNWRESVNKNRHADYVHCSHAGSRKAFGARVLLRQTSPELRDEEVHGEWMGFLKVRSDKLKGLKSVVCDLLREDGKAKIPDLLNRLVEEGEEIRVLYTAGHWLDVDSLEDLSLAGELI